MSDELRAWCGRLAAASDDVLQALVAPEPRRRRRKIADLAAKPEIGAWLSRLGGDLRHLDALPAEDASDDD